MRYVLFFCCLLFSVPAFAAEVHQGASDIEGKFLVNGGFSIGQLKPSLDGIKDTTFMGGRLQVDYGANQYLTIGLETGYGSAQIGNTGFSMGAVPILARLAWHPVAFNRIDPYIVGKLGYAIGFWTDEGDDYNWSNPHGGSVWGVDVGARFFITQTVGLFIETGYECLHLEWDHPGMEIGKWDDTANGRTYAIVGLTIKI